MQGLKVLKSFPVRYGIKSKVQQLEDKSTCNFKNWKGQVHSSTKLQTVYISELQIENEIKNTSIN